ncbi:MAG: hypothetical protein O3A84_00695 [Proteobacteria bacterium]|nr:hypothetical protein [Pseudomonadota bacterium]
MKHSQDRILTTHVGSLIRPPELLKAGEAAWEQQPGAQSAYETTLREQVTAVVKRQAETGIDIVNDGEYQRVHPTIMWAKLESLVQGARTASDELWG